MFSMPLFPLSALVLLSMTNFIPDAKIHYHCSGSIEEKLLCFVWLNSMHKLKKDNSVCVPVITDETGHEKKMPSLLF